MIETQNAATYDKIKNFITSYAAAPQRYSYLVAMKDTIHNLLSQQNLGVYFTCGEGPFTDAEKQYVSTLTDSLQKERELSRRYLILKATRADDKASANSLNLWLPVSTKYDVFHSKTGMVVVMDIPGFQQNQVFKTRTLEAGEALAMEQKLHNYILITVDKERRKAIIQIHRKVLDVKSEVWDLKDTYTSKQLLPSFDQFHTIVDREHGVSESKIDIPAVFKGENFSFLIRDWSFAVRDGVLELFIPVDQD